MKPRNDFMNPPEPGPNALEVKEALLRELEEKKKDGKHREWFEALILRWLKHEDNKQTLSAIEACLRENPVEDYSDADFLLLVATNVKNDNRIKWLYRLSRDIAKRKFVINRNLPQARELLSWNDLPYSALTAKNGIAQLNSDSETYAAEALLLSEVLSLTGRPDTETAADLCMWEKKLLQQPNIEAVASCLRSGFFVPEKADDYLEYIFEKGARELTPLFVSFKFQSKE